MNERIIVPGKRLGKAPAKSSPKMLHLTNFLKADQKAPDECNIWKGRAKFPNRMYANDQYGCCTRASQAKAIERMERLECKRTPMITDDEVVRVYKEMTTRLYGADWVNDPGNADTGAYETDALDEWRREDLTLRDPKGRPYTIDAYTRVNQANIEEVKRAIWLSGAHGIKVCMNLPAAFFTPLQWDIPEGQQPIGEYEPGSWGGHSMYAVSYDKFGVTVPTWDITVTISWRALAVYSDECHLVIDSINKWRKNKAVAKAIDLTNLKAAVNAVSSVQI